MITSSTTSEPNWADWNDERLVNALNGDARRDAFEEIMRRYSSLVYGVCLRELGNRHTADDAYQATFLVLWSRYGRITQGEAVASWLYAVAWRVSRRMAVRTRTMAIPDISVDLIDTSERPQLEQIEAQFEHQILNEELANLPARYREVLVGTYVRGQTNEELAVALGVSMGVIAGRLRRAKTELRIRMLGRGISVLVLSVEMFRHHAYAGEIATVSARIVGSTGTNHELVVNESVKTIACQELSMMKTFLASNTVTATLVSSKALLAAAIVMVPAIMGILSTDWPPESTQPPLFSMAVASELGSPFDEGIIENKKLSTVRERVEQALNDSTSMEFTDTPLDEVIEYLAELHNIPIRIDDVALKTAGVDVKAKSTFAMSQVALNRALKFLLQDIGLVYNVDATGLVITTATSRSERPLVIQKPSSKIAQIEQQLKTTATVRFQQTPLRDAIEYLALTYRLTLMIENVAIADAGIEDSVPVTLELEDVSLTSCLKNMLEQVDLTYIVEDEVIKITTRERATSKLLTRTYDLRGLSYNREDQVKRLVTAIETLGDNDAWESIGGPGKISILPNCIVVKTNYQLHKEIEDFLETIRQVPPDGFEMAPVVPTPPGGMGGFGGGGGGGGSGSIGGQGNIGSGGGFY